MKSVTENGLSEFSAPGSSCVSDTNAKANGLNSDFLLNAKTHALVLCDDTAVTEALHERSGNAVEEFDAMQPLAAAHHIATRSATGRLAKRPRKDLSPARSPPRKIGTGIKFLTENVISLSVCMCDWRRGSVVRMSVCSRRTFPDLRLIHG